MNMQKQTSTETRERVSAMVDYHYAYAGIKLYAKTDFHKQKINVQIHISLTLKIIYF